jgi:hypothetical protein
MNQQIPLEKFKSELLECLDETFERHHGIFLDRGTSLLETLENISAEEASRSIAENGGTIAAHVEHTAFYLDVLEAGMRAEKIEKTDWREIWERARRVTPEEWAAQKIRLRESYSRVVVTIENYDRWENDFGLSAALGVLAHTAYHLGAIRQAAKTIKSVQ